MKHPDFFCLDLNEFGFLTVKKNCWFLASWIIFHILEVKVFQELVEVGGDEL